MEVKAKHNTIISFGCWNQTNMKEGPSLRNENIMKQLKKVKNDIVLVSGDNYYPVKNTIKTNAGKEKIKKVELDQLHLGFKNLKKATEKSQVFMNFGNHDVVSNDQVNISENNQDKGECVIMNTELAENAKNFHVGMSHKILYDDHTLILMIDTSIYSPKKEFSQYATCYNQLTGYDQKRLIVEQAVFVHKAIRDFKGDNVIIVGHYPLFYEKEKSGQRVYITDNSEHFIKLLFEIQEYIPNNFYYLCADYHVYEEGEVMMIKDGIQRTIKQYIVGTGGTELDPSTYKIKGHIISTLDEGQEKKKKKEKEKKEKEKNEKEILRNFELRYRHDNIKTDFGFLKGEYKNGWTFSFIPCMNFNFKHKTKRNQNLNTLMTSGLNRSRINRFRSNRSGISRLSGLSNLSRSILSKWSRSSRE